MHAYPLRSLELKNFKSIADGAVEFKPLTVLVGMNSSGKSSLLQAIRFLSQTAQAHKTGIEVPLNGTKVRLGTFNDVRTVGTDGPISLQASFGSTEQDEDSSNVKPQSRLMLQVAEPDTRPDRGYAEILVNQLKVSDAALLFCAAHWLRAIWEEFVEEFWDRQMEQFRDNGLELVEIDILFNDESFLAELRGACGPYRVYDLEERSFVRAGIRDIRGAVASIAMPTYDEYLEDARIAISKTDKSDPKRVELLLELVGLDQFTNDETREWAIQYVEEMLAGSEDSGLTVFDPVDEMHPDQMLALVDELAHRAFYKQQEAEFLAGMPSHNTAVTLGRTDVKQLVDQIQDRALYRHTYQEGNALGLSIAEAGELRLENTSSLDLSSVRPVVNFLSVARLFRQECERDAWSQDPVLSEYANQAIAGTWRSRITELLQNRVFYLGPLRQEPQPYFNFGDDSRSDVGAAGEHLSRVLQWQSDKSVLVPGLGQAGLADGLQHWLRELELVEDVAVEARGRAGVSIEVRPTDLDRQVDLTSVGVGVSQVLPVLTVCLLAEPGDIVLLEQPELHLHPALQMRLADFLLACVDSGRQIIVETHSEHLVNRLRRRVAEDDSNEVGELVRIVFTERDAEGHTLFRPSDINPLGGLSEDWPDGFLDLGARDAQKLLQAGLAKHRRLSDN